MSLLGDDRTCARDGNCAHSLPAGSAFSVAASAWQRRVPEYHSNGSSLPSTRGLVWGIPPRPVPGGPAVCARVPS
jgi:hypothetical protein